MKEKTKEVNKSYKYRIYPSFEQQKILNNNIGANRFVFNQLKGMSDFQYKYPCYGNSIEFNPFNKYSCQNFSKQLKDCFNFLNEADAKSIQIRAQSFAQGMINITNSSFGFLKFKNRKDSKQSYTTTYVKIVEGKLKLPKIKETIKMKYIRPINGKILSGTVSNENNKWYISINVSKSIVTSKPKTSKIIGIDLGLKNSINCSTGFKSGKILLKKLDTKIKRLHQILAKKEIYHKNWFKTKAKLRKTYISKKNKIIDSIHKLTTNIVTDFDEIYVGNVNNKLGLKNKNLAKTTADQHWYEIKRQLKYKSDW
ncbi:MAG: transposase, partial [Methanobrevibacter sp.]|nr:transposase [Candidatus Methanovirga aequatorialis]